MEQQVKEFESLVELLEDLDREGITGAQRSALVRDFLALQARKKEIPYSGGFELTPLCNFDCKMCYVHLTKSQMGETKLLTVAQWKEIMQQAIDAGMMYADITGGECLTYPGFQELYLFLLSHGIRVSILTNGKLLSEEIVEFFKKNRPDGVQVSLYGSSPEAYRQVTGYDAFDDVISGIKRLKEANIRVKVSLMTHKYMKDDAIAMLELARSLNVEYAIGPSIMDARPDTGRSINSYAVEEDTYLRMRWNEEEYRAQISQPIPPIKEYHATVAAPADQRGLPCSSGKCGFHVNWKGELTPCIPFYRVNASILEHGFSTAWQIVKDRMKTYHPPTECQSCQYSSMCTTCPAEKTLGILNGPLNPVVCSRLKKSILHKC